MFEGLQIIEGRGRSKSREFGNLSVLRPTASHIRGRRSKCYVVGVRGIRLLSKNYCEESEDSENGD